MRSDLRVVTEPGPRLARLTSLRQERMRRRLRSLRPVTPLDYVSVAVLVGTVAAIIITRLIEVVH